MKDQPLNADPDRLVCACDGVQKLLTDVLAQLQRADETDWIQDYVAERVPRGEVGYWLIAALGTLDRTIGIVEGWLDHPDLPEAARPQLLSWLSRVLETGIGPELIGDALGDLITTTVSRTVHPDEVVLPTCLVLEVLTMTDDVTTQIMIVLG